MDAVFVTFILTGFVVSMLAIGHTFYTAIKVNRQFKYDDNPFRRHCGKCGAQQDNYHEAGNTGNTWWEEMYPIGNDPDCKCHTYANNHG